MTSEGFLAHLEALRRMILEILAIFIVLLIPGWFLAPDLLEFLQNAAAGIAEKHGSSFDLRYFTLMEPFIVELKAGMVIALAAGLPLYFWRFWKFLAPALYRHEKSILSVSALAAWILFVAGFMLGIFGVMPLLVDFSLSFSREGLTPLIGLNSFAGLMMSVALAFGVMFELPLILLALAAADIVALETLKKQRPLVLIVILVLAAFLTPPDVISQLMLGGPVYLLFELTLLAGSCLKHKKGAEKISEQTACDTESTPADDSESGIYTSEESAAVAGTVPERCYYRQRKRRTGALPRRKKPL